MALRESALKHDALRSRPSSGTPQAACPENKARRPFLKRRQWMEFNDQRWFPRLFRDMFNDNLDFLHRLLQPYAGVIGPLSQWTSRIGARQILDLASAGGGHVALLLRMAQQRELALPPVLMSDLYPSVAAWQEQQQRLEQDGIVARTQIGYVSEPVSALDVPPAPPRIWTIFSAFHHCPPEIARASLAHFCKTGDGLCIAELQRANGLTFP